VRTIGVTEAAALLPARIAKKFALDPNGCWTWRAAKSPLGYGKVSMLGKNRFAHRIVYELLVGPIPSGLTCDHLCRNRACVNPAHIEIVDAATNTKRGFGVNYVNAKKINCPKGHPLLPCPWYEGTRYCRPCTSEASKRSRQRRNKAA